MFYLRDHLFKEARPHSKFTSSKAKDTSLCTAAVSQAQSGPGEYEASINTSSINLLSMCFPFPFIKLAVPLHGPLHPQSLALPFEGTTLGFVC